MEKIKLRPLDSQWVRYGQECRQIISVAAGKLRPYIFVRPVLSLHIKDGEFLTQFPDLPFQTIIFLQLALQEVEGCSRLFFDAAGGQLVEVGNLVVGALEIIDLDQSSLNQGLDQIIDLAQTDSQTGGKLPLAQSRLFLDDLEDLQDVFIVKW